MKKIKPQQLQGELTDRDYDIICNHLMAGERTYANPTQYLTFFLEWKETMIKMRKYKK